MKSAGLLTVLLLIVGSLSLFAQDLHFTLYDYAPLSVNPANAGNYEGSYRIGGIYRDQWSNVSGASGAFRTPMVYIDAPLLSIGKNGWLGAGINVQLDEAGSLNQKTNTFGLAAAYHHVVNRRSNTVLSVGVQGYSRTRSIDNSGFMPGDILSSGAGIADTEDAFLQEIIGSPMDDPMSSQIIINGGIGLKTKMNKKTAFHAGLSASNINSPNQALYNRDENSKDNAYELPVRLNFHTGLSAQLNKKWTLNPTLLVSTIRNQSEIDLQVWTDYRLNDEKEIDLRFGLGHRLGRDLQPLLGINYGAIRAAVGYDIRLGTLGSAIDGRGGVELAVSYTGLIFKKPDVPPVIFCPQL